MLVRDLELADLKCEAFSLSLKESQNEQWEGKLAALGFTSHKEGLQPNLRGILCLEGALWCQQQTLLDTVCLHNAQYVVLLSSRSMRAVLRTCKDQMH